MPVALTAWRLALRVLPSPLRERWAAALFMARPRHPEPARERVVRETGDATTVAGLAATAFGPPDGPAAFLMHGWAGRGLQLSAYIEPLAAAGWRVYALDGPGHGRNPDAIGALPTFASFLEQAIHEQEPRLIIGHSLGAAASIVAARRTRSRARILALGGPPETLPIFRRARAVLGLPPSGMDRFMVHLGRYFRGHRTDDLMDIEAAARDWGGDIHGILAREDDEIPAQESMRIIAAAGGRAVVLDDVDHRSVMWRPEAVREGVAWVTGVRPGRDRTLPGNRGSAALSSARPPR